MNFIKANYEKLVLGLAIALLMGLCIWFISNLQSSRGEVRKLEAAFSSLPKNKEIVLNKIKEVNRSEIEAEWEVSNDPARGNLFNPQQLIWCKAPNCNYLLPFNHAVCPYCTKGQGAKEKLIVLTSQGNDKDNDSIPDAFEMTVSFLSPDNPADARIDYDKDGFLNVEEYQNQTDMQDPQSHPELGYLLRVIRVRQAMFPLTFTQLMKNSSDDKTMWDTYFRMEEGSTKIGRIGDEIEGMTIREINAPEGDKPPTVTLEKNDGTSIVLTLNQPIPSNEYIARIGFIRSRTNRSATVFYEVKKGMWRRSPTWMEGPLVLRMPSGSQDSYEIVNVNGEDETVKIKRTDAGSDEMIMVGKINMQKDFTTEGADRARRPY